MYCSNCKSPCHVMFKMAEHIKTNSERALTQNNNEDICCLTHFAHLVGGMDALRMQGELCDVILLAGNEEISAHRIVLASFSPYFSAMFTSELSETTQSVINIKEMDPESLATVVDFAYTGQLEITESTVQHLMTTAAMLQLSQVLEMGCTFLKSQLDPSNCLGIRKFAEMLGCSGLQTIADCFAQEHFKSVSRSDEFMKLDVDDVIDLISRDSLNVSKEEEVFNAVMDWVEYDSQERLDCLGNILEHVRLPLVSWEFLKNTVGRDKLFTSREDCSRYFQEARQFHARLYHPDLVNFQFNPSTLRSQPRASFGQSQYIYIVGGETSPGRVTTNDVECFHPQSNQLTSLPSMPFPSRGIGLIHLENKLFCIGGADGYSALNSTTLFDIERNEWRQGPSLIEKRSSVACALAMGCIYACGGYDGNSSMTSVEKFDSSNNSWVKVAAMPSKRSMAAAVAVNKDLYVIGGYDGGSDLKTVVKYMVKIDTWSEVAEMSTCRSMLAACVLSSDIYAVGGCNHSLSLSCVETYSIITKLWTKISNMIQPRSGVGCAVIGETVYAVGGHDGTKYLKCIEKYDKKTNCWIEVTHLDTPRRRFGCCS